MLLFPAQSKHRVGGAGFMLPEGSKGTRTIQGSRRMSPRLSTGGGRRADPSGISILERYSLLHPLKGLLQPQTQTSLHTHDFPCSGHPNQAPAVLENLLPALVCWELGLSHRAAGLGSLSSSGH